MQKLLIILLVVVAAAFWSYPIYLDSFYYESASREALSSGRVHPQYVHHGANVFLTEQELFNLNVLFPSLSIGSFLIAGLLDLRWKHFVFKKDFKGAR